jgi:hypothetical protein
MRVLTVAAAVFLTLGAILIVGNYVGIAYARRKQVGFSCIPILGGLLGCIGLLLIPRVRSFAFLPLVADPGCLPMLLALALFIAAHYVRKAIFNRERRG